jgi:hypothetical protein
MDKKIMIAIATLILLGGAYASYMFLQHDRPASEIGQEINIPSSPVPKPEMSGSASNGISIKTLTFFRSSAPLNGPFLAR